MPKPEFTCTVAVRHLPEQSNTEAGQYAFAYTVTIRNSGDVTGQLIARHWIINDSNGHVEEVRGLAVVGHQPILKPGETFEYTSWTRLATPQARCAAPSSA
jgi:ApaG protein